MPTGYRLRVLEETTSTNTACLDAATQGDPGRLWIMARRQTAGRGSRGRDWVSQEGNLFASLLLIDPAPRQKLGTLTFVVALAVRDTLADLFHQHGIVRDVSLKWPNDVLVSGRKVSGILLESHAIAGKGVLIAGVGVNCASHPDEVLHKATDLASEGLSISPEAFLKLMAGKLDLLVGQWARGEGFEPIRRKWLEKATGVGERIYVKMAGRELSGTFDTIDENGMLDLELDDGSIVKLSVADIFFSNPPKTRKSD
ncbi:MAG: biotin--[acetyl-CoA-carboxylase] ligase [Rhizobiaceae bacterium]